MAQEIYQRAREIISQGQLLIPFSESQEKYTINSRELERHRGRVKHLIERYLRTEGRELTPYRDKPGTYYFKDPLTGKRVTNVIFDAQWSRGKEKVELFSLSHPYVERLLGQFGRGLLMR